MRSLRWIANLISAVEAKGSVFPLLVKLLNLNVAEPKPVIKIDRQGKWHQFFCLGLIDIEAKRIQIPRKSVTSQGFEQNKSALVDEVSTEFLIICKSCNDALER